MNVIDQAMNVVQRADAYEGRVSLTLDLDLPEHRAALAAALAVLRSMGEEGESMLATAGADTAAGVDPAAAGADAPSTRPARELPAAERQESAATAAGPAETADEGEDDGGDPQLRRDYAAAVAELTPDADRQARIVGETFPRVRELLRDGANVAAVAQIQYRRWQDENPGYRASS